MRWQSWRLSPHRPGISWTCAFLLATLFLSSACGAATPNPCYRSEAERITYYHLIPTVPAISDGRVYVGVAPDPLEASGLSHRSEDEIVALRASDGALLWRRPDPLLGVNSLVVDHGILILSSRYRLAAMLSSDGTLLWQLPRGSETYGGNPASPVFDQDVVYASDYNGLYAARESDGQVLWHLPPLAAQVSLGTLSAAYSPYSRPLVAGGTVYVGSLNGPVAAVRGSDGQVLWQTFVIPPTPRIDNGSQPMPTQPQPQAVVGGQLYVMGGQMLRVRATDGHLEGPVPGLPQLSPPAGFIEGVLIEGTLYFWSAEASANQTSYSLWTQDAKRLWTVHLSFSAGRVTAADNGVLYTLDGVIFAIRLSDGMFLWQTPTLGGAGGAVGAGRVYASYSGYADPCSSSAANRPATVTAISEQDGNVAWATSLP